MCVCGGGVGVRGGEGGGGRGLALRETAEDEEVNLHKNE